MTFLRFSFLASLAWLLGTSASRGQGLGVEVANLREDLRLLSQRVNELQLKVEQLETENRTLADASAQAQRGYATVAQLNDAVADLNRQIQKAAAETKQETLQQVSGQMAKLARETNAALDALGPRATTAASSPVSPAKFSDDFPKEGIEYVIAKGDTLAVIARKTGGKQADIINANRISDPSKIQVGQKLFIPLAK